MRILIAIPCMDSISTRFAQSLVNLKRVGECIVRFFPSSLIYDARNTLCKEAIRFGCDKVLWLDSDMVFAPDTLERLLKHDKQVVSALYFTRSGNTKPVMYSALGIDENGKVVREIYEDYKKGLIPVAGFGFGCCLIDTAVLMKMAACVGDWFTPMNHFGEDLAFCLRCAEIDEPLYVDTTLIVGHEGKFVITENQYSRKE